MRGSLNIPSYRSPAIFIGPGTGIAPFRAFVQDRRLKQATGDCPSTSLHDSIWKRRETDTMVFFGCRSAKADFYYKQEWEKSQADGQLQMHVAASRDQVCLLIFSFDLNLLTRPKGRKGVRAAQD